AIAEDPVFARVGEPYMPELYRWLCRIRGGRRRRPRARGRAGGADRGLGVEQAEDALGGHHGSLHNRVLGDEIADGEEEAIRVLEEGDETTEGERAPGHLAAPVPEQQRDRRRADCLHRRVERGVVEGRAELTTAEVGVEPREERPLPGLAGEELDDAH